MKLAPKSLKAWIQGRRKDVARLASTTKRSFSSLSAGYADLDQESLRKRARKVFSWRFIWQRTSKGSCKAKLDAKARARHAKMTQNVCDKLQHDALKCQTHKARAT